MIHILQIYFLLFITYAFLGWCIEVVLKYIQFKRFINRGFLIGPWLPIYGWGALLITILLQKYNSDPVVLFFLGIVVCSILEYSTSYILEKIFRARWWDYSTKKFNINGRICLDTMIPFGIGGVLINCYINPILFSIYQGMNITVLNVIVLIIIFIFLIDNIVSFNVLSLVRKDNKLLEKDNTEEMSKKVIDKIKNSGFLQRRLLFAYPDFKHIGIVFEKNSKKARIKFIEQPEKYTNKQKQIMRGTEEKVKKIEEKYNKKIEKTIRKSNKKIIRISEKNNDVRKK